MMTTQGAEQSSLAQHLPLRGTVSDMCECPWLWWIDLPAVMCMFAATFATGIRPCIRHASGALSISGALEEREGG